MTTAIKICGIRSPDMAQAIAALAVDYVGVVLHPASPRFVNVTQACDIASALQGSSTQVVPVFVEQDVLEMRAIIEALGVTTVQLHSRFAIEQYSQLHERLSCIVAEPYLPSKISLDPYKDFMLYDNLSPGSGQPLAYEQIELNKTMRCFIAGGLNAESVVEVIHQHHPFGIDISSGVESSRGVKDLMMIKQLVQAVRDCDE